MRLVAEQRTIQLVADQGGELFVWARGLRCCAGRSYVLEASTRRPDQAFARVHEEHGVTVWATPGLVQPDELHLDVDRRGELRAFWNGQAWIG